MINHRILTVKCLTSIRWAFQNRKYSDVLAALKNSATPVDKSLKIETLYYKAASNVLTQKHAIGFYLFSQLAESATTDFGFDYVVSGLKLLILCESNEKVAFEFEEKVAAKFGHLPSVSALSSRYHMVLGNNLIASRRLAKASKPRNDEWHVERINILLIERKTQHAGAIALRLAAKCQSSPSLKVAILEGLKRDLNTQGLIGFITKASECVGHNYALSAKIADSFTVIGNHEKALESYEQILHTQFLDKNQRAHILCQLAYLNSKQVDEDTVMSQINSFTAAGNDGVRGNLYFALAAIQERNAHIKSMLQSLTHANQLRASHFSPKAVKYKTVQTQAYAIDDWTQAEQWHNHRNSSSPARVFVIGLPRSGSTLVADYLRRNLEIVNIEESDVIGTMARQLMNDCTPNVPNDANQFLAFWNQRIPSTGLSINQLKESAIIDKTLSNIFYVGLINRVFPNAHFIWISKPKYDQIWSLYRKNFGSPFQAFSFQKNSIHEALTIEQELKHRWISQGIVIHDLPLSKFLSNPQLALQDLITQAGLKKRDRVLPKDHTRISITNSKTQIRSGLSSTPNPIELNLIQQLIPNLFEGASK